MSVPRVQEPARRLNDAGRTLVDQHFRLPYILVRRARRAGAADLRFDELLAEANYALVYAAGRFDPSRDVPFGAYATMVIKHRLIRAIQRLRRRRQKLRPIPTWYPVTDPSVRRDSERHTIDAREICLRAQQVLPRRLYDVLWLRLGEGRTLASIGRRFGFSRQRAMFLVQKATRQLRDQFPEWGSQF